MLDIGVRDLYQVESEEFMGAGNPRLPNAGIMPTRNVGFGLPPPASKLPKQKRKPKIRKQDDDV